MVDLGIRVRGDLFLPNRHLQVAHLVHGEARRYEELGRGAGHL